MIWLDSPKGRWVHDNDGEAGFMQDVTLSSRPPATADHCRAGFGITFALLQLHVPVRPTPDFILLM